MRWWLKWSLQACATINSANINGDSLFQMGEIEASKREKKGRHSSCITYGPSKKQMAYLQGERVKWKDCLQRREQALGKSQRIGQCPTVSNSGRKLVSRFEGTKQGNIYQHLPERRCKNRVAWREVWSSVKGYYQLAVTSGGWIWWISISSPASRFPPNVSY